MESIRATPDEMSVVGRRRTVIAHVRDIWSYRELLTSLVHKELKVRYKGSVLGFVWSMVQPVFLLVVYTLVFSILGAAFDRFPIWLLCGLVMWNFVSTCCTTAVQSITQNAYLVSKVRFPRAILPLSNVGAAGVHLALQFFALGIVLAVSRHPVDWAYVWLLIPAVVTAALLCSAIALFVAALNVKARDTQHLLDLALLGWFWLTPVLYTWQRAATWLTDNGLHTSVALINPITSVMTALQRGLYGTDTVDGQQVLPNADQWWYLRNLALVSAVSLVLLAVALRYFDRAEADFAEDL